MLLGTANKDFYIVINLILSYCIVKYVCKDFRKEFFLLLMQINGLSAQTLDHNNKSCLISIPWKARKDFHFCVSTPIYI